MFRSNKLPLLAFLLIGIPISLVNARNGRGRIRISQKDNNSSPLILKNGSVIIRPQCTYKEGDALVGLKTPQILSLYKHKAETHYVTTADGYILEIHRVPAPGKPVVFMLPGILQTSRDMLLNCKERSIASKLIKAGYDVWLGNFRGTPYGRNHTSISPKLRQFWKFSWDELYEYDAPATVDYILGITGQKKLNWVGFSLGNTVLIGMLSIFPEYNEKVISAVAMGPAIYLGNAKSQLVRFAAPIQRAYESLAFLFLRGEFLPPSLFSLWQKAIPAICSVEAQLDVPAICSFFFSLIDGRDVQQLNLPFIPAIAWGAPAPYSARVYAHWFQLVGSGKFQKYSYGTRMNLQKYGSRHPPVYNISNVKVPIMTMWGENDDFTTRKDVKKVVNDLPNVVEDKRIDWDAWNHLDFLYGKDADILVYDDILNYLAKFNKMN